MRARLLRIAAVPAIAAVAAAGCGGGGNNVGTDPPVLTRLEVTPATTTLFTVSPGTSVKLGAVPKDQYGETMTVTGSATFHSQDEAVATVAGDGKVTAVGAGSTEITAELTEGAATAEGTASVTVKVAAAAASVSAPAETYLPKTVDVSAGGTVTWTFGVVPHDVSFTTAGAPGYVAVLERGSASLTFPDNGVFQYKCTLHPGMSGEVRVH